MENLIARSLNARDGHGGRAEEHHKEIKEIAEDVFFKEKEALMEEIKGMILQAQYEAYEQALNDVIKVLEYDIHSVTKIGIQGCKEVFEGEKAQKFMSDQMMKTIVKGLRGKHFKP